MATLTLTESLPLAGEPPADGGVPAGDPDEAAADSDGMGGRV